MSEPWDGEHCQNCLRGYDDVYWIDNKQWSEITGWKHGEGLLCPPCFQELKEKR